MPNLQSIAAAWGLGADDQPIAIDMIRNSYLLQTAIVRPSNAGIKHSYRPVEQLPTAAFRSVGNGIVPQLIEHNRAEIALKELVFDHYDDYAVVEQWPKGKDGYVEDNYPSAIGAMTNSIAQATFYGNHAGLGIADSFKGLLQYADDFGNTVSKAGAGGSQLSIIAVRWDETTGASLRYNNTDLLSVRDMTPDAPVPIVLDTATNSQLDVYKWKYSSYFTLVVPSMSSVGAITKIAANGAITVTDMNDLVNFINKPGGFKAIYCNSDGMNKIAALKDAKLSLFSESFDYNNYVAAWRGVPIFVEDNLVSTENR